MGIVISNQYVPHVNKENQNDNDDGDEFSKFQPQNDEIEEKDGFTQLIEQRTDFKNKSSLISQ